MLKQVRNMELWVRHVLIKTFVNEGDKVCEVFCGKGADIGKYKRAKVGKYVGVDYMEQALDEAKKKWKSSQDHLPGVSGEFFHIDIMKHNIKDRVDGSFDVVSCAGRLDYAFANKLKALNFISNISKVLQPKGFFFGFMIDSSTVWTKAQPQVQRKEEESGIVAQSADNIHLKVPSHLYRVDFLRGEKKSSEKSSSNNSSTGVVAVGNTIFQAYGSKYSINYVDGTSHSHFMVHLPTLIKLAEKYGLRLLHCSNFLDFFNENKLAYKDSLQTMGVLGSTDSLQLKQLDLIECFTTFVFQKD